MLANCKLNSEIAVRLVRLLPNLKSIVCFAIAGGCMAFSTFTEAQLLSPIQETSPAVESKVESGMPYEFASWIAVEPDTQTGYLVVSARLADASYLHSLTQEGPSATKLEVAVTDSFEIAGVFRPDQPPKVIEKDPVFGKRQEKHFGSVEFYLPIRISANQVPEDLQIKIRINGQVCTEDSMCLPIRDHVLVAKFNDYIMRENSRYPTAENTTTIKR